MKRICGIVALLVAFALSGVALAEVTVEEGVLCTAVSDRKPAGAATSFPPEVGKVFAFTKIAGTTSGSVTHRWIYGGKTALEVKMAVNGSPWRVWSEKNIRKGQTGEWKVDVVEESGKVIKTLVFTVGAPGPSGEPKSGATPEGKPAPEKKAQKADEGKK